MEIYNRKESSKGAVNDSEQNDLIIVRAILSCSSCGFKKKFRNHFRRSRIEEMVVSLKCFDWLCCYQCGDLLNLNLEFEI